MYTRTLLAAACILSVDVAHAAAPVCAESGIPTGLYQYEGEQTAIDVQVDEHGCAAYKASQAGEVQTTKTFHDRRGGSYDIPYRYNESCTVYGLVVRQPDGKLYAHHTKVEGNCLTGISDVVDQAAPWAFTAGTRPVISLRVSAAVEPGKRKHARLPRHSTEIAYANGQPSLQWEASTNANVDVKPIWAVQPDKEHRPVNMDALYQSF